MDKKLHPDAPLITGLGGPTKVAKRLGFTPQRVQNWLERGIPPAVKVEHPRLFLKKPKTVVPTERAPEESAEAVTSSAAD
jgi:hypothetical protein